MYIPESSQKYNLIGREISHLDLAMKAAKGMRRSRQKVKTGHIVCRHLLDMLSEEPQQLVERKGRMINGSRPGRQAKASSVKTPANDKQFRLAL